MSLVVMSSDKHSSSPRHSHSSPAAASSAAGVDVNCASVVRCPLTSHVTLSRSQSSHVLSSVVERLSVDDDTATLSVLFEDKSLWHDSFSCLYEFYQTGTFCDVEIHVGSQRVNCHRLVLACFSQYFRYHMRILVLFVLFFESWSRQHCHCSRCLSIQQAAPSDSVTCSVLLSITAW